MNGPKNFRHADGSVTPDLVGPNEEQLRKAKISSSEALGFSRRVAQTLTIASVAGLISAFAMLQLTGIVVVTTPFWLGLAATAQLSGIAGNLLGKRLNKKVSEKNSLLKSAWSKQQALGYSVMEDDFVAAASEHSAKHGHHNLSPEIMCRLVMIQDEKLAKLPIELQSEVHKAQRSIDLYWASQIPAEKIEAKIGADGRVSLQPDASVEASINQESVPAETKLAYFKSDRNRVRNVLYAIYNPAQLKDRAKPRSLLPGPETIGPATFLLLLGAPHFMGPALIFGAASYSPLRALFRNFIHNEVELPSVNESHRFSFADLKTSTTTRNKRAPHKSPI